MARKGENIFKRKDGRWEARYICQYENGRAKYRYLYGTTYREVKQKKYDELQKRKEEALAGTKTDSSFSVLAAEWPEVGEMILSEKDKKHPTLAESKIAFSNSI